MRMMLPVPQGEPLLLRFSPGEECVYFENLQGTAPVYVQFAVHPEKHMLVVRRCSATGRDAGALEPSRDGKGYHLDICYSVLNALYSHFNVHRGIPCRIRSIDRVMKDDSAFLFDLKKAEAIGSTADSELSRRMMKYE